MSFTSGWRSENNPAVGALLVGVDSILPHIPRICAFFGFVVS